MKFNKPHIDPKWRYTAAGRTNILLTRKVRKMIAKPQEPEVEQLQDQQTESEQISDESDSE